MPPVHFPGKEQSSGARDVIAYVPFFLAAYLVLGDKAIVRTLFLAEILSAKVGVKKFQGGEGSVIELFPHSW